MLPIRTAEAGDLSSLMHLIRAMQREQRVANPEGLSESLIRRALFGPAPTIRAFVIDSGVSLDGFALYQPTFSIFRAGPAMHVDAVYVRETSRNRGCARALVGAIARECHAAGIAAISWFSARTRDREEAMLARLGVRPHDNLRFVRAPVMTLERSL
jgi:GNAT superfamily N-acetyltransferase